MERKDCECSKATCVVVQNGKAREMSDDPSGIIPTHVLGGLDTCSASWMRRRLPDSLEGTKREI